MASGRRSSAAFKLEIARRIDLDPHVPLQNGQGLRERALPLGRVEQRLDQDRSVGHREDVHLFSEASAQGVERRSHIDL